ncbi:hypothetical protein PV328_003918 [Microctonus aethiopoides]|uniref:ERCC4 domain-containing protein n=1 Tax=Microctonus aethiopoides TaxID=144406 RepID=A0AA39KL56_9HYME|nr:hypothetical protein PV328_003918 [Microctonus aethiopoides]
MDGKQSSETKKNAARERIMKKIAVKQQKNIQPGECMKFIEVNMNDSIRKNFDFYQETLTMLESASVAYSMNSSLLIPDNCISWTRIIEEYSISEDNKLITTIRKEREKHMIIIWKWDQVVKQIYDKTFVTSIAVISASMSQAKLTFVIYGIERYFEYYKQRSNQKKDKSYTNIEMQGIPKISKKDLELSLIDIQIGSNCTARLIENSSDMSLLIYQYTKAIAEKSYKLEIKNRLYDQIDFFAAGDNKKPVNVDNDGYGLRKLWLKQLCMFNSSSLTTADAICSVHSSPDELMNAYMKCSNDEDRDELLKSIQIKKGASGPLTKVRKLGPELSRKIHIMFTSTNGEQLLN